MKEPIRVTDKRIFTSEGDIREEFKGDVHPVDPSQQPVRQSEPAPTPAPKEESATDKKKKVRDQAANPGTPFTNFLESLILNAYMSMGMLRHPSQPTAVDLAAARQMIDIVVMLGEKTKGNLTEDEHDFLQAHLGELKLAFVQRNKGL